LVFWLDWDSLNLTWGNINILTILILLIHEYGIPFQLFHVIFTFFDQCFTYFFVEILPPTW
jgi:hypothetical protein